MGYFSRSKSLSVNLIRCLAAQERDPARKAILRDQVARRERPDLRPRNNESPHKRKVAV